MEILPSTYGSMHWEECNTKRACVYILCELSTKLPPGHLPDRAIMMINCSLLISFFMMCRLLHSVRASGRMKGVTGADWASFCLRKVATSVYRGGREEGKRWRK